MFTGDMRDMLVTRLHSFCLYYDLISLRLDLELV